MAEHHAAAPIPPYEQPMNPEAANTPPQGFIGDPTFLRFAEQNNRFSYADVVAGNPYFVASAIKDFSQAHPAEYAQRMNAGLNWTTNLYGRRVLDQREIEAEKQALKYVAESTVYATQSIGSLDMQTEEGQAAYRSQNREIEAEKSRLIRAWIVDMTPEKRQLYAAIDPDVHDEYMAMVTGNKIRQKHGRPVEGPTEPIELYSNTAAGKAEAFLNDETTFAPETRQAIRAQTVDFRAYKETIPEQSQQLVPNLTTAAGADRAMRELSRAMEERRYDDVHALTTAMVERIFEGVRTGSPDAGSAHLMAYFRATPGLAHSRWQGLLDDEHQISQNISSIRHKMEGINKVRVGQGLAPLDVDFKHGIEGIRQYFSEQQYDPEAARRGRYRVDLELHRLFTDSLPYIPTMNDTMQHVAWVLVDGYQKSASLHDFSETSGAEIATLFPSAEQHDQPAHSIQADPSLQPPAEQEQSANVERTSRFQQVRNLIFGNRPGAQPAAENKRAPMAGVKKVVTAAKRVAGVGLVVATMWAGGPSAPPIPAAAHQPVVPAIEQVQVAPSTFPVPLPGNGESTAVSSWEEHTLTSSEHDDWEALTNIVTYDAKVMGIELDADETIQVVNFLKNYQIAHGVQIDPVHQGEKLQVETAPLVLMALDCLTDRVPLVDVPSKAFNGGCLAFNKLSNASSVEAITTDPQQIAAAKSIQGYTDQWGRYYAAKWDVQLQYQNQPSGAA